MKRIKAELGMRANPQRNDEITIIVTAQIVDKINKTFNQAKQNAQTHKALLRGGGLAIGPIPCKIEEIGQKIIPVKTLSFNPRVEPQKRSR